MKTKLLIILILAFAINAQAGSATWNLNPGSSNWGIASNWTPATVPNGPADTATFAVSNNSAVSVIANFEVNGIAFSPGASAFTITSLPTSEGTIALTISGTGISNQSGTGQNFVAGAHQFKPVIHSFLLQQITQYGDIAARLHAGFRNRIAKEHDPLLILESKTSQHDYRYNH